jgi:hypothetical protein
MTECMLGRAIPARRILPKAVKAFSVGLIEAIDVFPIAIAVAPH